MKKKYNLVGSSNVVFTHSYGVGLYNHDCLEAYVDVGKKNIKYPSYLDDIPVVQIFNNSENRLNFNKIVKILLKKLRIDRKKYIGFLLNRRDEIASNRTRKKIKELKDLSQSNNFMFVWSTSIKKEFMAIKEEYGSDIGTTVLSVNTYPIRGEMLIDDMPNKELIRDRDFFNSFDKIIVTSEIMKSFFLKNELSSESKIIISPDYLPSSAYKKNKNNKKKEKIKAVYLGNVNFNERTIDDITILLTHLSSIGVEVWLQKGTNVSFSKINGQIKYFEPFTYEQMLDGTLGEFVSGFHFSIVAYNGIVNARTNMGFPTRYALAMTGGIPIFVQEGVFLALEEQFSDWNIYYKDIDDISFLLDKLDSQCMAIKNVNMECKHSNLIGKIICDG